MFYKVVQNLEKAGYHWSIWCPKKDFCVTNPIWLECNLVSCWFLVTSSGNSTCYPNWSGKRYQCCIFKPASRCCAPYMLVKILVFSFLYCISPLFRLILMQNKRKMRRKEEKMEWASVYPSFWLPPTSKRQNIFQYQCCQMTHIEVSLILTCK